MDTRTRARAAAGLVLGVSLVVFAAGCGNGSSGAAGRTTLTPASTSFRTIPVTAPPTTVTLPPSTAGEVTAGTGTGEPAASGGPQVYVVKAGDAWPLIARIHAVPLDALLAFNSAQPLTPIYVGDRVRIPPKEVYEPAEGASGSTATTSPPASVQASTQSTPKPAGNGNVAIAGSYTVKFGDYWILIAKKHGVRLNDLYAVNNAGPNTPLKVGGTVNIPAKR
jgi:LysM repeat protein